MHAAPNTATIAAPRKRIAVVGGHDRALLPLIRAADDLGYDLEGHHGRMAGRGSDGLAAMIGRADVVVILTDINSHNAVLAARRLATAQGRPYVLARRLGPGRLAQVVAGLATH